ncbi:transferase 1, rSAM/selenodomain-associated [alpha proteobacterium Q-1]|nr:transferase 1, rSAM/selenodomain-associated [alpha proteobacterium Q-1]
MSGAIAIFVKTPGLTPAKTRLARGIGTAQAEDFYHHSLDCVAFSVARFLKPRKDWIARWAVAEAEGVEDPRWRDFGARHTGPGTLGERMWRVYEGLRRVHGQVFLIGADAPQMGARHLKAAQQALEEQDFVFGPAHDGGFWLFGGKRPIPKPLWLAPRYSTAHARADFIDALKANAFPAPAMLDFLNDIDEAEDLAALTHEMPATRSPAQRRLMAWLRQMESDQTRM